MHTVRTYKANEHGFFGEAASLFIYLASLNTATEAFAHLVTTIPNTPAHTAMLAGRVVNVSFPIHELMHGVVLNTWPQQVTLAFSPPIAPTPSPGGVQLQSDEAANHIVQLIGTAFLKYYERNAHRPKAAHTNSQRAWPAEWRFAWLLRNAIAHGDRWVINDTTFPETVWHGVSVSSADTGKPWFDLKRYIGGGDIFLLLEELDA